jgi:hypothetical protein
MPTACDRQAPSRRSRRARATLIRVTALGVLFAGTATGCRQAWRPPAADVRLAPAALKIDLRKRWPARPARRTFARTRVGAAASESEPYVIFHDGARQREGALADIAVAPMRQYVQTRAQQASKQAPAARFPWPIQSAKSAAGLILQFDPPLTYLPALIEARVDFRSAGNVRVFSPTGLALYTAPAQRRVRLEGYESITIGDATYSDCVRLFTATQVTIPWVAGLDVVEYVWLAPRQGMVRRVQRISGRIFWRFFDNAWTDDLVKSEWLEPAGTTTGETPPAAPFAWSAAALYFQPARPEPHLAGAVFELAEVNAPRQ